MFEKELDQRENTCVCVKNIQSVFAIHGLPIGFFMIAIRVQRDYFRFGKGNKKPSLNLFSDPEETLRFLHASKI